MRPVGEMAAEQRCGGEDEEREGRQALQAGLGEEAGVLNALRRIPVGGHVGHHDAAGQIDPSPLPADQEQRGERVEHGE